MATYVGVSAKVYNLNKVIRGMKQLGVEAQDLKEGFTKISTKVADSSRRNAPVRTGNLRAGIKGSKRQNGAIVTASTRGRQYAGYVHWGTELVRADRFILQAVAQEAGFIQGAIEDALETAIRRAGL